jgi:hypothetical protein
VLSVGDLDGDGVPDRVAGAPGTPSFQFPPAPIFGRVVAYSGRDGSVLWDVPGPFVGDRFGTDLADAGDLNGDGVRDVAVAAPGDFPAAPGSLTVLSGVNGVVLRAHTSATNSDRARVVRGGGDFDGDLTPDLLACDEDGARVYSGASGLVVFAITHLQLLPPCPNASSWCDRNFTGCFVKDLQGDGFDEIALGVTFGCAFSPPISGWAVIAAGPTGTLLAGLPTSVSVPPPAASAFTLGHSVADAGDVDGDGVHDLAFGVRQWSPAYGAPDFTEVRSGATFAPLWTSSAATAPGAGGRFLASVGDVDGDGRPELATSGIYQSYGTPPPAPVAGWSILDGATGAPVWSILGATAYDYGPAAAAGDVDLDGKPDVLFGSQGFSAATAGGVLVFAGTMRTHSGVPLAAATVSSLGGGCGSSTLAFAMTPPVFGASVAFALMGAAPLATAYLLIDLAPNAPTFLGAGCVLHPDAGHVASWIVAALATDAAGAAATSLGVPFFPLLAGAPVTVQALVIDPAAPLGFTLSDGKAATLGY